MDKILILLKKETITLYDIDGGKAAVHTISGEEVTDAEDYELVAEALRENYNDDELEDLSVDVVYTACDTEMIKSFTEELLPCGGWQVFEFKKILPEILLKNGMLKPDTAAEIAYDGDAYKVSMSKDGEISIAEAEDGTTISDTDIAAIYRGKFNVFSDKGKIEVVEGEKKKLTAELETANKTIKEHNMALSKLEEAVKEKDAEISKLKEQCKNLTEEINEKKKKERPKDTKDIKLPDMFVYNLLNSTSDIPWKKKERTVIVKKGEILAEKGGFRIIAPRSGLLIKRKTDSWGIQTGHCAGVIVNNHKLTNDEIFEYNDKITSKQWLEIIYKDKSYENWNTNNKHLSKISKYTNFFDRSTYGSGLFSSTHGHSTEASYDGTLYYLSEPDGGNGFWYWNEAPNGTPLVMLVPNDMSKEELDVVREGLTGKKGE